MTEIAGDILTPPSTPKFGSPKLFSQPTYTFTWPHHGHSVALAGGFDSPTPHWQPIPMEHKGDHYELTLPLAPGKKYLYKYVVDGNWIVDRDREAVWDNQGNNNHEISVEAKVEDSPSDDLADRDVVEESLQEEEEEEALVVEITETTEFKPESVEDIIVTEADDVVPATGVADVLQFTEEISQDGPIDEEIVEEAPDVPEEFVEVKPEESEDVVPEKENEDIVPEENEDDVDDIVEVASIEPTLTPSDELELYKQEREPIEDLEETKLDSIVEQPEEEIVLEATEKYVEPEPPLYEQETETVDDDDLDEEEFDPEFDSDAHLTLGEITGQDAWTLGDEIAASAAAAKAHSWGDEFADVDATKSDSWGDETVDVTKAVSWGDETVGVTKADTWGDENTGVSWSFGDENTGVTQDEVLESDGFVIEAELEETANGKTSSGSIIEQIELDDSDEEEVDVNPVSSYIEEEKVFEPEIAVFAAKEPETIVFAAIEPETVVFVPQEEPEAVADVLVVKEAPVVTETILEALNEIVSQGSEVESIEEETIIKITRTTYKKASNKAASPRMVYKEPNFDLTVVFLTIIEVIWIGVLASIAAILHELGLLKRK